MRSGGDGSCREKPPPPLKAVNKPPTVHISIDTTSANLLLQPVPVNEDRRPVSAMAALSSSQNRWLAYRDERTSSSSSDSGVVVCLSPPAPTTNFLARSVTSLIGHSPPGLSPLNVNDSPFSTPTPSSVKSRFTFDHLPCTQSASSPLANPSPNTTAALSPGISNLFASTLTTTSPANSKEASPKSSNQIFTFCNQPLIEPIDDDDPEDGRSAFGLAKNRESEELTTVLKRVRGHSKLERKASVVTQSLQNDHRPLSSQRGLSLSVSDPPFHQYFEHQQLLLSQLYAPRAALTASLSSPLVPTVKASTKCEPEEDAKNMQYYCHVCKKDFKRPDILSRHVRRHTGEKPFGCDDCGRFFSRSDHLRTHRRTHTDEKPYQCTICSYSARRRDVLTRHMSTRHQAKAGLSVFQKHRNARRCLSDGDALIRRGISAATSATIRNRLLTSISSKAATEDVGTLPRMEDIEDDVIVDDEDATENEEVSVA